MLKDKISIENTLQEQIIAHCKECYPKEACGILSGKGNKAEVLYKLENISETPEMCYAIDTKTQLNLFKELRSKDLSMVAIYHSHTNSKAYPSAKDLELAFYPDSFYVIVSLVDKERADIRAFRIIEQDIKEIDIIS